MSSVLNKSRVILRSNLVLSVLVMAGCMKPMTNGQTVIDPSHDGSPDPAEIYDGRLQRPDWRENVSPKVEVDLGAQMPGRKDKPTVPVRAKAPGDQPDDVLEDNEVPYEESNPDGTLTTPAGRLPPTTPATPTAPATPPTSPTQTRGTVTPVPQEVPETPVRRRFNPTPRPQEVAPAPAATGVVAPTSPTTKTVTAPPAKTQRESGVTAPTAATKPAPMTAATGSPTDVSGRRFRPIPRPEVKPVVTAPSGVTSSSGVTATTGAVAPSGKVEDKPKTAPVASTGRVTQPRPVEPRREEPKKETATTTPQTTTTPQEQRPANDGYSVRPADNRDISETGTITPTIYFVAVVDEDKESCADQVGMHLMDGSVSMRVCRRTASFCSEQGSCMIKKGGRWHSFNVVRRVNGIDRYVNIKDGCVYGYGVQNICLDPYYTLAADLSVYDPGDVIFIPKIRGLKLPNGARHDGYFIVRDKGRGVKGRGRFDFFSGAQNWGDGSNPLVKMRLNDKDTDMTYHKVSGDLAKRVKAKRGYPKLPSRGTVHSALNQSNTKGVPTSHLAQPGQDVTAGHGSQERPSN